MHKLICRFTSIADCFNFGRYKNLTLADVLEINPSYVIWCLDKCDGVHFLIEEETIIQINKAFPEIPITSDFEEFCKNRIVDYETDNEDSDEQYNSYHTKLGYRSEISFDRYSGSYAQDEMEYSDDDIDTIFDGYPNAYWNID